MKIISLFKFFGSIFFPQKCIINHQHFKEDCDCADILPFINLNYSECERCGYPLLNHQVISFLCGECIKEKSYFDYHRSIFIFKEPISNLIYGLKYGEQFEVLSFLVESIIQKYQDLIKGVDYLMPIPLSKTKLVMRGFNQSLELVKRISKITQVPFLRHELMKSIDTKDQIGLSGDERRKNLNNSFKIRGKTNLENKIILLIDDVYTTGSTINECAKILKKHQVKEVYALTIARKI